MANIQGIIYHCSEGIAKKSTTAHQYSAAYVQEMVDKRLHEYTFEATTPPPPQDENRNPNLPPIQH